MTLVVDRFNLPLRGFAHLLIRLVQLSMCLSHAKEIFGIPSYVLLVAGTLTINEILPVVRVLAAIGIYRVGLIGGEPLLSWDIVPFIARVAKMTGIDDMIGLRPPIARF